MIYSEDGATPLLSTAQRYLPSHSSSYRTIPSVPLPVSAVCITFSDQSLSLSLSHPLTGTVENVFMYCTQITPSSTPFLPLHTIHIDHYELPCHVCLVECSINQVNHIVMDDVVSNRPDYVNKYGTSCFDEKGSCCLTLTVTSSALSKNADYTSPFLLLYIHRLTASLVHLNTKCNKQLII